LGCNCCSTISMSDKPLVKDFLTLNHSLYLVLCVTGPTHQHVHTLVDIIRECCRRYQNNVKTERNKFFSDTVSTNCHKPYVLFRTTNSINVPQSTSSEATRGICEKFLNLFVDKVKSTRTFIPPFSYEPFINVCCSTVFNRLAPVSF